MLAIEPSLLYLIGADPTDPVVVWRALGEQFQRRTWANKLELKRKLFSMRLAEGGSVQEYIKFMTEICDELSVIGQTISEEDRVVYLLASLNESYNVLVTDLEASAEVPTLAVVRERLLHEETKTKSRSNQFSQALTTSFRKKLRCHFCNKPGHFKNVKSLQRSKVRPNQEEKQNRAFKVIITAEDESDGDSEGTGLVV